MYYTTLDGKNGKVNNKIILKNCILFQEKPTKDLIQKSIKYVKYIMNKLHNDSIYHYTGIILTGSGAIHKIVNNYVVYTKLDNIDIIFVKEQINNINDVNMDISNKGLLYLGYNHD